LPVPPVPISFSNKLSSMPSFMNSTTSVPMKFATCSTPPTSTNLPRGPIAASENSPILSTNRTALVTCCGRICIYKKKINLSTSLAGQAVGIKEVDDGIWLVSFMDYLGYIDLEEKTLQPLDNPFGPRV